MLSVNTQLALVVLIAGALNLTGCIAFPTKSSDIAGGELQKHELQSPSLPASIDTSKVYFNNDPGQQILIKKASLNLESTISRVYAYTAVALGLPAYGSRSYQEDLWYEGEKLASITLTTNYIRVIGLFFYEAAAAGISVKISNAGKSNRDRRSLGDYIRDDYAYDVTFTAQEVLRDVYPYLSLKVRRKLYKTELDFVENEYTDEQKKAYYAEKERERQRKLAAEEERKRRLAEKRERERRLAEKREQERERQLAEQRERERQRQLAEQRERERLEYERRVSVGFSGGAPTFSSWQQALPYSGTSSGKALLDIKNRYEATATAYLQLADKQTQIPKVPQPELPPQVAVEQGKYESDKTFEERVQAAIDERNDKIVQLQERYQQQVAERNARIDALNQLQRQRQAQLEDNKIEFMADAMRAELVDFKVRNASFDQATALLYFDLYSTNSDYQELIAIETHDPVITERLAENPEQIQPELTFRIEGDGFSLQQVTLKSGAISEVAQVMVAKNVNSRGQQRVVIDSSKLEAASGIAAVAGLQKQNPNIVDRFRTGVITYNNGKTEQRDTGLDNDELWLAAQELRNSRLNDNAFLFVIGIEDYKSAAPVPYAENSALVTKELLRVKAGVPDKNVYLLTQDKTTGTQIRGELSKMLGRLDSDSLVYFYYAGHGVPDIGNNESVYLLPADAVQGAYQDDNFKLDNIMRQIAARQPQHAYFFLDTCFSGRVNRNELLFPGVGALMVETIKPKVPENVTVFYGGQGTQFANAFEDKRHRLMSYYLAKGVLDGKDSISELSSYVNRAVRKESLVKGGDFRQEPFIDGATEGRLFRTAAAR